MEKIKKNSPAFSISATSISGDQVRIPKAAPKKTTQEDVRKTVSAAFDDLREQSIALNRLVASLESTLRADVSISTVEETKKVLNGMEACRKHVIVVRDVLKSRVRTRLLEV